MLGAGRAKMLGVLTFLSFGVILGTFGSPELVGRHWRTTRGYASATVSIGAPAT